MEGVGVGPNHHHHFLERVRSSSELSPVDPVLVSAPVMAPTVPDPIEVGVSTGIIPPSSLLIVGTVSCREKGVRSVEGGGGFAPPWCAQSLTKDPEGLQSKNAGVESPAQGSKAGLPLQGSFMTG